MASDSPLLRLPAELRNTIYELVPTAPRPLYYRKPEDGRKSCLYLRAGSQQQTHVEPHMEYNQLKYVSKQLYGETTGLELKYNDVVLYATSFLADIAEELMEWLCSICDAKKTWIKTISIEYEVDIHNQDDFPSLIPETSHEIDRLTRLCNQIPSITVKYNLPLGKLDDQDRYTFKFFSDARLLSLLLHGKELNEQLPGSRAAHALGRDIVAGTWWNGVPVEDLQAGNLAYYPTIPEGIENCVIGDNFWIVEDDGAVEEAKRWIGNEYLKRWIENGI
jgi:hypothetical protein